MLVPLILAVDDDAAVLEHLAAVLEPEGYRVACHGSAGAALDWVNGQAPDLVISDLRMPEMDGLAFRSELRRRFPLCTAPFVFLSSMADPETVSGGLDAGADDYLLKPVAPRVLVSKVRALLRAHRRPSGRSFRGSLVDFPVPALLRFCEVSGLTGFLEIQDGASTHSVRFEGGRMDEDAAESFLAETSAAERGHFVLHSQPVDFRGLDGSTPGATPDAPGAVLGRLSGIRLHRTLLQVRTELVDGPERFVVTTVGAGVNEAWRLRGRVAADATAASLQAAIDAQHQQVEQEVHAKLDTFRAKVGPADTVSESRFFELLDKGLEHFTAGEIQHAVRVWEEALALRPDHVPLQVNLRIARDKLTAAD